MTIIPAIDLQNGQCVRLFKGNFDQVTTYHKDPITLAQQYAEQGATWCHVVDLEGARAGKPKATTLIKQIKSTSRLKIQTGGGIRTLTDVEKIFANGIDRVVIGSLAITQPDLIKSWLAQFGAQRFVLALDVRLQARGEPLLVTHGWQQATQLSLWSLLTGYADFPGLQVLCTDVELDGVLAGPNVDLYCRCMQRFNHIYWQASGGVSSLDDLALLRATGVDAVIVGKALYEKRFSLNEAMTETKIC